jgi:hypothetical protein
MLVSPDFCGCGDTERMLSICLTFSLRGEKKMTLVIKPVQLNKSLYIRVPSDLVDMIGLWKKDEFNLTFQETDREYRLVYTVLKHEQVQDQKINPF